MAATRTPLGTASGTTSATLANVTLQPGDWLIVGHAQHQADQAGNPQGTWNGIALDELHDGAAWEKQHGEIDVRIFGLYTATGGTGSLIMHDDGIYGGGFPCDGMCFWATAWSGLRAVSAEDADWSSLGHPSTEYLNQTNFNTVLTPTTEANEILVAIEVVWRPDTDLGTLDASLTAGQIAIDTHGSSGQADYVGLHNRECYRTLSAIGTYTISVTRSTGSEWVFFGGTLTLANASPPHYFGSYDIPLYPGADLIGGGPLPEVQRRLWARKGIG